MARIGIAVPGVPGHLNPVSCVGRELQARGHRAIAFEPIDGEEVVRATGLEYEAVGLDDFPRGAMRAHYHRLGELRGLAALKFLLAYYPLKARMVFREGPEALRRGRHRPADRGPGGRGVGVRGGPDRDTVRDGVER